MAVGPHYPGGPGDVPMETWAVRSAAVAAALAFLAWGIYQSNPAVVTRERAEPFLPPADQVVGLRVSFPERTRNGQLPLVVPARHVPRVLGVLGRARKYKFREGHEPAAYLVGSMTLFLQGEGPSQLDFGTDGTGKLFFCYGGGVFQGESVGELKSALAEAERDE
jgi:hypothetical protein